MSTERAFLTAGDTSEAWAAAMELDHEVREIANDKRKPGRLSLEKLAIVISFVRERSQAPASQAPDERKLGVHLSHCNFGEHAGTCAYGDDENCQALSESWSWFGKSLQRSEAAKAQADEAFELGRQQGMEQERALWQLARDGQGMEAPSSTQAEPPNLSALVAETMSLVEALCEEWGHGDASKVGRATEAVEEAVNNLALLAIPAAAPAPEVPSKDALPHVGCDEQGHATLEWWRDERKITMYPLDGMLLKVWGTNMENEMDEVRLEDHAAVRAAFNWLAAAPRQGSNGTGSGEE